eukprot:CAMPEP_0176505908 /NCGR_PEP_ID=MMETSP0200_2-20121128/16755_1 /TAXON_ID=947934 /ORGANISM="Chaetoceros sp., Strain GSL56" /LENGTH=453 /DNA_ID=CAMNT_0017905513 /DNA_START=387 /DNA_END=1749 /DNA_ORIENTATION=+
MSFMIPSPPRPCCRHHHHRAVFSSLAVLALWIVVMNVLLFVPSTLATTNGASWTIVREHQQYKTTTKTIRRRLKSPKSPKSPKSLKTKSPKSPKSPKCNAPLGVPDLPDRPELIPTATVSNTAELIDAIDDAEDGDVIFLNNGAYDFDSALEIDKSIALIGESRDDVVITDTRGDKEFFVSISSDDVILQDLTINHDTTAVNIGHAIVVSNSNRRLDGFRMYNVKSQYSKGGLSIRCDNFVVQDCIFEAIAGSSRRRGILHYGNGGNSFILDNTFENTIDTQQHIAVYLTSTSGNNPLDDQEGSLVIQGSIVSGKLFQFVIMDNHQGDPDSFELFLIDNTTAESNAFLVSFGGTNAFGNVFSRMVLVGNVLTNQSGKGLLAIDAGSGLIDFRNTTTLEILSKENELGNLVFQTGWAEALGWKDPLLVIAYLLLMNPMSLFSVENKRQENTMDD